jgi:hypothetical protein
MVTMKMSSPQKTAVENKMTTKVHWTTVKEMPQKTE